MKRVCEVEHGGRVGLDDAEKGRGRVGSRRETKVRRRAKAGSQFVLPGGPYQQRGRAWMGVAW
ncbi:predicted protein [Pyrenophora tritici-repentis Pt-1C-BFP]|uniref:Uncharacterized protein n=1 Tax=Pyrenophora tritici-repentis (strain Pt-1C-BFP) TaxID=426418 RepID=B2VXU5_PYRTR|nr:uncharacterized protein PTRG_03341 [Pyrenophora tritici-repentis Pt-1C-BFP]EDU45864.1 predicted protein [Pyrenophora tritici-repentis Pt-1C-BFP]